ncbi:MAG: ribosome biogenesis/translation initiation ATPase RLI, partial [Candidatus ainarchaeum sp.]|nr:ribosome biogenesis/translation initiation ATPase RLI [Candidatus ainarchaeum sp.]
MVEMTRIAVIDRDLCTNIKCGYVCEKVCPVNRMGKECIKTEENGVYPVISEPLCIGCGICVKKCPVQCISIINLKEEIGAPLFQYGVNQFRVHGMPLPKDGVTGLIGRNGIGKTTSLKILTKQLIPNFGDASKELDENAVLAKLTMEQRRYWEAMGSTQKASYKPQNILQIGEMFSGSVKELLAKFQEGRMDEAIEKFGLEKILGRKLKQLSGGELQKVAIAIAYVKNADIYFFDEPTNYLDIAERMRIAVILKDFSQDRRIMVAEHDLAILDYASDYVYLFWGDESVYGMVSGVKNVRSGINEYLSGFLRDENTKFREYEIMFSRFSESERKRPVRFSYAPLKKKYKGFALSCDGGDVREGEIVGIVGRNALGKSTLVKMLAGVEKPDKGEGGQFKVSYKPQYVKAEEGVRVEQLFESKNLNEQVLEECKRRLGVSRLMLKKLDELSGG